MRTILPPVLRSLELQWNRRARSLASRGSKIIASSVHQSFLFVLDPISYKLMSVVIPLAFDVRGQSLSIQVN